MRLICPNCGAQYEVDAAVIPDHGRDVQCSNCGHTWFQQPDHVREGADSGLAPPEPVASPFDEPKPAAPVPSDIDPQIASILREEADREAAARQADAEGLETQPDLGFEDKSEPFSQNRLARLRGWDEDDEDDALGSAAYPGHSSATGTGSRRELLPDVDEINSSLRASDERPVGVDADGMIVTEADARDERRSRGASRWMFRLIVVALLVAIGAYVFAPQIVASFPQAEPALVQYVDAVNALRDQIDPIVANLVSQVSSLVGGGEDAGTATQ